MPSRRFHSIAALCGDGLRPELKALFERLAVDPQSELFVRSDGMVQSGPDPAARDAPRTKAEETPLQTSHPATGGRTGADFAQREWKDMRQ
jgi:hypothetical protein